jgi:hypothetical protein
MDHRQSTIGPNPARSTAGDTDDPGHGFIVLRWARHWPYATASLIGLAVWFATIAILAVVAPAAPPAIQWYGLLVGVAVGATLAGLQGNRGWVVVPVIIVAFGCIVEGILTICGLRLP